MPSSTTGPDTLALLRADQIARLAVGPVHPKSVILGADPQGEGAEGACRCLAIGVAARRPQSLNLLLQLVEPLLNLFERSARVGVWLVAAGGHQPTAGQANGSNPETKQLDETLHGPLLIGPSLSAVMASGQPFTPINRCTLSLQLHAPVTGLRQGNGLLQAMAGLHPADQNQRLPW